MTDDRAKTPRTLLVADHLWDAFSVMAVEMGSDRDSLVNQALHTFARLNGYLVPGDLKRLAKESAPVSAVSQPIESSRPRPQPGPPTMVPPPPDTREDRMPVIPEPKAREERPAREERQAREERPRGNPDRVAEIAQQLGSMSPRSTQSPPPPVSIQARLSQPEKAGVEVDDSLLGDDGALSTSMDLPNLVARPQTSSHKIQARAHAEPPAESAEDLAGRTLVLLAEGRELDRVIKDRFLIGRGKHCDLIINSGKVSREHAAITRENGTYFIEDLGSSNGTWFDKRRISRRQIQEGDEYFICSERLTCSFR